MGQPNRLIYDPAKLARVVEAAKTKALEVGKPDLAAAVADIHMTSLSDERLTQLLDKILTQTATKTEMKEFQDYVKASKKRVRAMEAMEAVAGLKPEL